MSFKKRHTSTSDTGYHLFRLPAFASNREFNNNPVNVFLYNSYKRSISNSEEEKVLLY